jgi:hypothetical protein
MRFFLCRHCEQSCAIQEALTFLPCFAALAMTAFLYLLKIMLLFLSPLRKDLIGEIFKWSYSVNHSLSQFKTIGFIMSPSLGDALFSMIIPYNLQRHGYKVTVFNNFLYALRPWFPDADIQPWPDINTCRDRLKSFDLLLYVYQYNDKRLLSREWHPNVVFLNEYSLYHRSISMADIQVAVCKELFGLTDVLRGNGMLQHPDSRFRCKPRQVAIHPTGASQDKYWLSNKFATLAEQLKQRGYEPVFIVSPKEKEQTRWILDHNLNQIEPTSIDGVAQCIYESGWFIGSDSGLGHLASSFGIPTVTLMARHSINRRWRPSFAPGKVLLPSIPLLFKTWKIKYWKYFVSVKNVLNAFEQLTQEHPANPPNSMEVSVKKFEVCK